MTSMTSTNDSNHQDFYIIEGYASVFNIRDLQGDIVQKGAFAKSIDQWKKKGSMPKILWQHDHNEPVGITLAIKEDDKGLAFTGKITTVTERGKGLNSFIRHKMIDSLSIGYIPRKKTRSRMGNIILEAELVEISIVTFPANEEAKINHITKSNTMSNFNTEQPYNKLLKIIRSAIKNYE